MCSARRVAVAIFAAATCVASRGLAAPVDFQPATKLSAHVAASVSFGSASDSQDDHDAGSLDKRDVSAATTAIVPLETSAFGGSGNAASHLILTSDGFTLTSSAASTLSATQSGAAGEARSVTSIDLPFVLHDDFTGGGTFQVDINSMVLKDEKVTIVLDRTDVPQSLFDSVFTASADGKLPAIGRGEYRLQLITGAISTNKGVADENGTANVQLSFAASDPNKPPTAAIPIPAAAWPGGAILLTLLACHRRLRRIIA